MPRPMVGLFVGLALSLLVAPLTTEAQSLAKLPRIGVLGRTSASAESFWHALRDLGYVEGQNLAIESRWVEDQPERLPALATEMVQLQPTLLVTFSHRVALAAKEATTTTRLSLSTSTILWGWGWSRASRIQGRTSLGCPSKAWI